MARNKKISDKINYFFGQSNFKRACNTILSLVGGKAGLPFPLGKPLMLQVEVTNRCNINCRFCSRSFQELQLGDLSPGLADQVVELSSHAQEVALFGYGEPLISRSFYELLPRLRCSRFMFFTNGLILDQRLLERILDKASRPLSGVVFSMDGSTKATYEAIRKGSDFDRVWRNLRSLASFRVKNGMNFEARLEFVAMRSNIGELPDLIRMAASAGLDGIKVSHLVVWQEDLRHQSLIYDPQLCGEMFAKARQVQGETGIWLDLPQDFSQHTVSDKALRPPCRQPWRYVMISYEGDVRACCFAPELTMGNLSRQSFSGIWHAKAYANLRERINSATPPAVCLRCEERFRYVASPDDTATYIKLKPRTK